MILNFFLICSLILNQLILGDLNPLNSSIDLFVVNGSDAKIEELPHQASLVFVAGKPEGACGASLLNSKWLITAKHCIRTYNILKKYRIFLGNNSLNNFYNNLNRGYEIDKIIEYPYLDLNRDIALIKLKNDVFINNKSIKPACLLNENNKKIKYDNGLVFSGWGRINFNLPKSIILQKSKILNDTSLLNNPIHSLTQIFTKGDSTVCKGDSGGPLTFQNPKDNENYLVGVAKRFTGPNYCEGESVFERISYYLNWILKTIDMPICVKNFEDII